MVFLIVMLLPLTPITKNHIYRNFSFTFMGIFHLHLWEFCSYIYGNFILTFMGILFLHLWEFYEGIGIGDAE